MQERFVDRRETGIGGDEAVLGPPLGSRRRTALDWIAVAAEENGREIVEVYLAAARRGECPAAEALMSRIYGKPEAALVARVSPNPVADVIRAMSLEEKLELLRRLRSGDGVGTVAPSALATITGANLATP